MPCHSTNDSDNSDCCSAAAVAILRSFSTKCSCWQQFPEILARIHYYERKLLESTHTHTRTPTLIVCVCVCVTVNFHIKSVKMCKYPTGTHSAHLPSLPYPRLTAQAAATAEATASRHTHTHAHTYTRVHTHTCRAANEVRKSSQEAKRTCYPRI